MSELIKQLVVETTNEGLILSTQDGKTKEQVRVLPASTPGGAGGTIGRTFSLTFSLTT